MGKRATQAATGWLGIAGTGVAAAVAAVGAFVVTAAPSDLVERQLVRIIQEQSGRTLTVAGGASFTFFPTAGVRLSNVSLSGPPGVKSMDLLAAEELRVEVPLWPLLRQRVEVQRFVLTKPVLTLHTSAEGVRNWEFAKPGEQAEPTFRAGLADGESGAAGAAPARPVSGAALAGLHLGDVRIIGGRVSVVDERGGPATELTAINAVLSNEGMDQPAAIAGSLTYAGTTLPVELNVAHPMDLLEGRKTRLTFKAGAEALTARFAGDVTLSSPLKLGGTIGLDAAAEDLLPLTGATLPAGIDPAALAKTALSSTLTYDGARLLLTNAQLNAAGGTATGTASLDMAEKPPVLSAVLTIKNLDLDRLVPPVKSAPETAGTANTAAEPLNFAALDAFGLDTKLTLEKVRWRGAELDTATASATLRKRVLKIKIKDAVLLEGRGHATVALDATKPEARLEANAAFSSVAMRPLLKAGFGLDCISGRGDLTFGALGIGRSSRTIMAGLLGQGRFSVEEGSITGIDLGAMARVLRRGELSGWTEAAAARTGFSSLTGSVSITKGVARTQDLALTGPLVQATAVGTYTMTDGTVDAAVRPIFALPLLGDGGAGASGTVAALQIPLRVTGPIGRPAFYPDLQGLVQSAVADPGAALRALQQVLPKGAAAKSAAATGTKPGKATGDFASRIGTVLETLGAAAPAEAGTAQ